MSKASDLTNKIIDFIYRKGGYAYRSSSTGIYDTRRQQFRTSAKKGVSDVIGVYQGQFLAIEVKIGADSLRPEQEGFLKNITHHGGLSVVAKDYDEFKKWWKDNVEKPIK